MPRVCLSGRLLSNDGGVNLAALQRESERAAVRFDPAQQILQIHRAGLARNLAAPAECNQRWNAADAVARGDVGFGLGVEFRQPRLKLELRGGLCVGRCHHAAGRAPLRPEIHHQWQFIGGKVAIEARAIKFDRIGGQQGFTATAAARRGFKPFA